MCEQAGTGYDIADSRDERQADAQPPRTVCAGAGNEPRVAGIEWRAGIGCRLYAERLGKPDRRVDQPVRDQKATDQKP
jgi:hypothetical protein